MDPDEELARIRAQRREEVLASLARKPSSGPQDVSMEDFDAFLRGNRLAMVDLWASWCAPCRVTNPLVEQLAKEWEGRIAVAKVNADAYPDLLARFRISGIPTFLFFRDGTLVGRLIGAQPKAAFDEVAAELLA